MSFPAFFFLESELCLYNRKKIVRRLGDMNFIFSCWKQYSPFENQIYIFAPLRNILYLRIAFSYDSMFSLYCCYSLFKWLYSNKPQRPIMNPSTLFLATLWKYYLLPCSPKIPYPLHFLPSHISPSLSFLACFQMPVPNVSHSSAELWPVAHTTSKPQDPTLLIVIWKP